MIKYMYCWNLAAKLEGNLSPMVLAIKVNSQFSTSVLGCWWNLTQPLQLTPRGYFIHDRAEIQNISSSVEKYFTRSSIIQHERRNFASPSSHEIMCYGRCHAFARKPIWYFTGVYTIYKSCTHIIFFFWIARVAARLLLIKSYLVLNDSNYSMNVTNVYEHPGKQKSSLMVCFSDCLTSLIFQQQNNGFNEEFKRTKVPIKSLAR